MKTLTLIRHATANNNRVSQQDNARNLSELGRFQAQDIARQLKQKNCLPDYLLCSPANRTLQTATLLCHTLELNPDLIKISDVLYSGDAHDILSTLRCVDSQQLFVVGHNPHLSWLAHLLCNSTKIINLPPAGVISLEFEIDHWSVLTEAQGRLLFFIEPHHESS
ncbi:SixA phosphatase family protein [Rickettsiella endosymbiont of Dermanyssus gallinae]|uniref:SixA phosphatase family protein n=1 Tax=Rickettsiella endosymbiont of Dermanyssus gallinae TaxID=2856608 RepID=UPI001C52F6C7|nr:histidine phosphatase family protein [Rickettsiella endosymbiont of Dermanyssus gallinae]